MTFNCYTGDGNVGTRFSHEIEAGDLDEAIAVYLDGVAPEKRDLFEIDGEGDDYATLTVYEDEDGSRAYNDGAFFIAEIYPADNDPRVRM